MGLIANCQELYQFLVDWDQIGLLSNIGLYVSLRVEIASSIHPETEIHPAVTSSICIIGKQDAHP